MLQKINIGRIDRIVWVIAGLVAVTLLFESNDVWGWFWIAGLYLLATGCMASCPLYTGAGLSTRRRSGTNQEAT